VCTHKHTHIGRRAIESEEARRKAEEAAKTKAKMEADEQRAEDEKKEKKKKAKKPKDDPEGKRKKKKGKGTQAYILKSSLNSSVSSRYKYARWGSDS